MEVMDSVPFDPAGSSGRLQTSSNTRDCLDSCFRGVIAIPARLASTRLANKLLLCETGRPLLAHVIERAVGAVELSDGLLADVVVACDHPSLQAIAKECGVRAVMTGDHHRCGTTRIAEAVDELAPDADCEFIVNVQGDEPEVAPEAIVQVARTLLVDPQADMATLAVAMQAGSESRKADPNAVKVVFGSGGRAIYFSRGPIPFDRVQPPSGEPLWHHHIGIYAYRRSALAEFAALPVSALELREGLEQLRAIEAGKTIKVCVVPAQWAAKGVDTREDYEAFVRRCA